MILNENQKLELIQLIDDSLDRLYQKDSYLIEHRVHERSIVFRFCYYFQNLLKKKSFSKYHLDCEYNKNHSNPKCTENFPNGTVPDVIIHKRGSNDDNLCMIEFKTWWDNDTSTDIEKIQDFTNQNGEYKYGIGISIVFNRTRNEIQKTVIQNGEVIDE